MITYRGETLCATDWAERIGIDPGSMLKRLKMRWTGDRLMSPRDTVRAPKVTPEMAATVRARAANGETQRVIAMDLDLSEMTVSRIVRGLAHV